MGNSTNFCGTDLYAAAAPNNIYAFAVTIPVPSLVLRYGIYSHSAGVKLKMGLYKEDQGRPGTLLESSQELTTVAETATEGNSTSSHTMFYPSGTYWLGFVSEAEIHVCAIAREEPEWSGIADYSQGLPASFPAEAVQGQVFTNAYIVVESP